MLALILKLTVWTLLLISCALIELPSAVSILIKDSQLALKLILEWFSSEFLKNLVQKERRIELDQDLPKANCYNVLKTPQCLSDGLCTNCVQIYPSIRRPPRRALLTHCVQQIAHTSNTNLFQSSNLPPEPICIFTSSTTTIKSWKSKRCWL